MQADQTKPILRLNDGQNGTKRKGSGGGQESRTITQLQQAQKFGPKFQRLQEFLDAGSQTINTQPDGIEPEKLLVFEVTGSVRDFIKVIENVEGLTFSGEELLDADELDEHPQLYLFIPDVTALKQIISLWRTWIAGHPLPRGSTPWKHLFTKLRDVRPWGPRDRVRQPDIDILQRAADMAAPNQMIRVECELIFRADEAAATAAQKSVEQGVSNVGGKVISSARHPGFRYHAVLADLPASEIKKITQLNVETLAGMPNIYSISPQSRNSHLESNETEIVSTANTTVPVKDPIGAVFDAVPLSVHPWLDGRIIVSDPYNLESISIGPRVHGTAMASIAIHGDKSLSLDAIDRKLYFRSVMFAPGSSSFDQSERFQDDRLIIDLMVEAVETMRAEGFHEIVVVNLSLGDANKQYHGRISAWARALDYLAYKHGILFIISSGNVGEGISLSDFQNENEFRAANDFDRKAKTLKSWDAIKANRKILAPAESVNALTVGAWHRDGLEPITLPAGRYFAFPGVEMPNLSSALGLGHKGSVKPDILLPGGREQLILKPVNSPAYLKPHGIGSKFGGIQAAAPPIPGSPNNQGSWILGSSPAAAYATYAAHKIYEQLEKEYDDLFLELPNHQKAALLKTLIAHPASWLSAGEFIRQKFTQGEDWQRIRRDTTRYLGYGFVNPIEAVYCASDRATMWATGKISENQAITFNVPIPNDFNASSGVRTIKATLGWLSPVRPNHQNYRSAKLRLLPLTNEEQAKLGVSTITEPHHQQTEAGTLIHRQWTGASFGHSGQNLQTIIQVQREKDQGTPTDTTIHFGLVVSVQMNGNDQIYDEVLSRIAVKPKSRIAIAS